MTSNAPEIKSDVKTSSRRVNGANFLFGSAFLILAFFYAQAPCENSAIVFLLIHGTTQLSYFIIGSLKPDDFTLLFLALLDFGTIIWGMANIFSAYPSWQSNSLTDLGYCPRTPYLTAFIYLVAYAVSTFLVFFFGCVCLICTCGFKKSWILKCEMKACNNLYLSNRINLNVIWRRLFKIIGVSCN